MIITVKNLQQQTLKIEIDESCTVSDLKNKIMEEKGPDYPVENQKLIYSGKILTDTTALKEYDIDPNKFVVVMVSKPKIAPTTSQPAAPVAVAAAVAGTSSSTSAVQEKKSVVAETETKEPAADRSETKTAAQTTDSTVNASTSESMSHDSMVQNIVDMGYNRTMVVQALKASFNNPDRAVEYLINGIPANVVIENDTESSNTSTGSAAAVQTSVENPLNFLRTQPQFNQMRQIVQNNPDLLNAVLQQVGQTNPELLQLISQNQEAFVRLLNEEDPSEEGTNRSDIAADAGIASGGGNPATLDESPAVSALSGLQLAVTQEDKDAIERLKALGYPEHLVIQAYFACEKNENLAANFLLSQNLDD